MAITITGNAGNRFSVTVADTATLTGTATIAHTVESGVGDLTIADTDEIVSYNGNVGTTAIEFDLQALDNFTGGTDTIAIQNATAPISLTSLKSIQVHNKSANVVTLEPGTSNSFLTASEQITIPAGASVQFVYSTAATVSASVKDIKISADVNASAVEIYLIGA